MLYLNNSKTILSLRNIVLRNQLDRYLFFITRSAFVVYVCATPSRSKKNWFRKLLPRVIIHDIFLKSNGYRIEIRSYKGGATTQGETFYLAGESFLLESFNRWIQELWIKQKGGVPIYLLQQI